MDLYSVNIIIYTILYLVIPQNNFIYKNLLSWKIKIYFEQKLNER